jgi:phospholipase C
MRSARLFALSLLPVGLLALAPLAACSSSSSGPAAPADAGDDGSDTRPPTPPAWDRAVTRPSDSDATSQRAACKFARGSMPAETLGTSTPVDKDIPIETIVVLMMENHSFDNYFGHLGKYANRTDIESAPDNTTNPTMTGATPGALHNYQHAPHLCTLDTNHEWDGAHLEWDNGKNDGFFQVNDGFSKDQLAMGAPMSLASGERALYWYDERDIPFYYKLASTFAIADHYHSSLIGPTFPNRDYLVSATSFGLAENSFPDLAGYEFPDGPKGDAVIIDELERRHVSWGIYADGSPGIGTVVAAAGVTRWSHRNEPAANFFQLAAAGQLPQVVFVDPLLGDDHPNANDEHPPSSIQSGQKFASDVVRALMSSPQWGKIALFVTWDENGGFYDHVAPPSACKPDGIEPIHSNLVTTPGSFDRLGFRVPLVVVSPYAKKGYVGHTTYDHTSITRFIEAKFKVPALTARDANADPLMDMFDFTTPAFATPPSIPEPTIDQAELTYCKTNFL